MAILITGGSGFVGFNLARRLVSEGEKVVIHDISPRTEFFSDIINKVTIVRGDILDLPHLLHVMKENNVDRIVHLAAITVHDSQRNPIKAVRVNIDGFVNVLEAARIMDVKRVVFTSSQAVYGVTEEVPIDEDYPKRPNTVYAATKLAGEQIGLSYLENYGLEFVVVRFPLVYGYTKWIGFLAVQELVENPLMGLPVSIGGGSQKFEPLYVKDAINAIILAMNAKNLKHRIFNIGSGEMLTLQQIAEVVRKFVPSAIITIKEGYDLAYTTRGLLRFERAREELGYNPSYNIEKGIQDYIECWKQMRSTLNI